MANVTECVGVVIVERAGSWGRMLFVEEFAGNYVLGLHCADPSDVVALRVRWRRHSRMILDKYVLVSTTQRKDTLEL
jgi:hypothetical protein